MTPPDKTRVWDLPVRLFHWLLVALVVCQVVTVSIGGLAMEYHALGGYAILTLVVFRIAWGLFGSRHARFSSFLYGPKAVAAYACGLLRGKPQRYAGHNPLGGWSVMLMLASLLVQTISGLFADDDILMRGPLARHVSGDTVSLLTKIHDTNAIVLFTLIAIHIAAVLFYLMFKRENLIGPMFSGYKRIAPPPGDAGQPGIWRAIALLAASGAAVYGVVNI
ncbi:MAG TPA: cytochrome b/b6 domain-containing protein [Burkholderiales bacterium]|nr:cytochrome b/b6 domain-containing protein [Burkholderiales bacterium]